MRLPQIQKKTLVEHEKNRPTNVFSFAASYARPHGNCFFRCLLSLYCICENCSSCAVQRFFMILFDFCAFVKANFYFPSLPWYKNKQEVFSNKNFLFFLTYQKNRVPFHRKTSFLPPRLCVPWSLPPPPEHHHKIVAINLFGVHSSL